MVFGRVLQLPCNWVESLNGWQDTVRTLATNCDAIGDYRLLSISQSRFACHGLGMGNTLA